MHKQNFNCHAGILDCISSVLKDPETIPSDGVRALSKLSHPTSPDQAEQQHSGTSTSVLFPMILSVPLC